MNEASQAEEAEERRKADSTLERRLSKVDVNLLVALDALLACRNVTYAARRVGQTQPAMSRTLGRLRDFLGDDLLVRGSAGLRLTTRAEHLAKLVPVAMSQARGIIGTERTPSGVRISINTNLMPALLPHFAKSASFGGQRLKISSHRISIDGATQLRSRLVDFVVGTIVESGADIRTEIVCAEDFVTLVAFEHHRLGGARPTADMFLALSHVNLIDNGREIFPQVAETLSSHGVQRSDLCEVPDVASAALMVSQGGLALTVPRSMAGWLTRTLRIATLAPPVAIPHQEIFISWFADDHEKQSTLIADIVKATREAIAADQAAVRTLRPIATDDLR